jgi:deoxycytidine triphosphate deaminase
MIHIAGKAKSYLKNISQEDIQPNAVDIRLGRVFKINKSTFTLTENEKVHRGSSEIVPLDGRYCLDVGTYEVIIDNFVHIAQDEAGIVITRSTLNRNGVFLTSGLYDSGYEGIMNVSMHVTTGKFVVEQGTRIGQFVLFKSEALHKYNGSYGSNSSHDQKYTK